MPFRSLTIARSAMLVHNAAIDISAQNVANVETEGYHRQRPVIVADDHRLIRSGLRTLLDSYPDIHVIGEACNGEEAVEMAGRMRPDAVIMDVNMPRMNGIQATRAIKRDYPDIVVIGLSVYNDRQIEAMMTKAGATIMLNKGGHPEDLYLALREARAKPR